MAFIPIEKMKALREAAKKGDERAKKIIRSQMLGEDFSSSLDEYFKTPAQSDVLQPKPAQAEHVEMKATAHAENDEGLRKFLEFNGVKEGDEDYDSTVEAYYQEFPKARRGEKASDSADDDEYLGDVNLPNDDDDGHSIYGADDEPINDDEPVVRQGQAEERNCIDDLIEDEYEAIQGYDKAISEIMRLDGIGDAEKKGIISDLSDIRKDETEHVEKLKRIKESLAKKEEKQEAQEAQQTENAI